LPKLAPIAKLGPNPAGAAAPQNPHPTPGGKSLIGESPGQPAAVNFSVHNLKMPTCLFATHGIAYPQNGLIPNAKSGLKRLKTAIWLGCPPG
jgi:hypothetical protein